MTIEWASVRPLRGNVKPVTGREVQRLEQVVAGVTHTVQLRYVPDLNPKDRLMFGTRILNIEVAQNVEERNREMLLLCIEEV